MLVPLAQILAFLYVLVPVRMGLRAPGQEALFRILTALRPWGMSEVFVLGAIVALVKLSAEAEVSPHIALDRLRAPDVHADRVDERHPH